MAAVLELMPQHPQQTMHTAHASYRVVTHVQLVRSHLNVRHAGKETLEELAALIASRGLLQNLVGYIQLVDGVASGIIEIVAGWRRACAIGQLIARGALPIDYEIPVLIVSEEEAVAISLAENSGREPMHPADVFDAMLALAARNISAADIGIAFGVSELTVRRRLKLAKVAPCFVAMYREDKLGLEQMEALALVDDHAQQEQAWDSLDQWSRGAHQLRRLLTMQRVDMERDRVALYVGLKAYRSAGGSVTQDLFSKTNQGFIDDPAMLDRLASAKLAKFAKTLGQEGWQWVDVRVRADQADLAEYARVRTAQREPNEQESQQQAALAQRIEAAQAQLDALDDDAPECEALEDAIIKDEAALAELRRGLRQPLGSDVALAGVLVTLDATGSPVVYRGLIRPDDRVRMCKDAASGEAAMRQRKPKAEHSERLTLALTAHRTAALQAVLAERPDVALCALTARLAANVFAGPDDDAVVQVTLKHRYLNKDAPDMEASRAWSVIERLREEWAQRLPEDSADLFGWLAAQPQSVVLSLLAFCVAWGIDAVSARNPRSETFIELAKASGLDMADWWKPTSAGYLEHVPKQRILELVRQALSAAAAQRLTTAKKDVVCIQAEKALAEVRWLPSELSLH